MLGNDRIIACIRRKEMKKEIEGMEGVIVIFVSV